MSSTNVLSRRQYNTENSNTMYRKSTNPFLEADAGGKEANSGIKPKPARPSASTKPTITQVLPRRETTPVVGDKEKEKEKEKGIKVSSRSRPRRSNSDSSLLEPSTIIAQTSPEKSHRSRDKSSHRLKLDKNGKPSSSSKKRSEKKKVHVDTIDRLDVTGIFGPGSFHHDGPFDACNPNRNKNSKRAPVAAFPIDGANNSLSGVDPTRDKYATENTIMGRANEEAYLDYSKPVIGRKTKGSETIGAFDPRVNESPVHGDVTWGLGSTTFLDGTPAPRSAIKQSGEESYTVQGGGRSTGLGRKKSLVQKLRGGVSGNSSTAAAPAIPSRKPQQVSPVETDLMSITKSSSSPSIETAGWGSPKKESSLSVESKQLEQNSSGGGGGGLLRRVKSLKVTRRKN